MRIARSTARSSAFTVLELIAVIVLVMFSLLVLMPPLTTCKSKGTRVKCTGNLKQGTLAFTLWSQDANADLHEVLGTSKQPVDNSQLVDTFRAVSNQLRNPQVLICPGEKKRKPVDSFEKLTTRNISYFLAMDLNATNVNQVLLGDRGLATNKLQIAPGLLRVSDPRTISWANSIHDKKDRDGGNVALIDGSAHQVTSKGLRDLIQYTGFATNNRFLIP